MKFLVNIPSTENPADLDAEVSDSLWLGAVRQSIQQTYPDAIVLIDDRPEALDPTDTKGEW